MKIAVPTMGHTGLQEQIADHFGRCETYTFLNEQGELLDIIENTSIHKGGQKRPPELLYNNDVTIILCPKIGSKALHLCNTLKMIVYLGQGNSVQTLFESWLANQLLLATNDHACQEHHS